MNLGHLKKLPTVMLMVNGYLMMVNMIWLLFALDMAHPCATISKCPIEATSYGRMYLEGIGGPLYTTTLEGTHGIMKHVMALILFMMARVGIEINILTQSPEIVVWVSFAENTDVPTEAGQNLTH